MSINTVKVFIAYEMKSIQEETTCPERLHQELSDLRTEWLEITENDATARAIVLASFTAFFPSWSN